MKKTFHHPISKKKINDPILGELQVECRDTSTSTIAVMVGFAIIAIFFFYCSYILTATNEKKGFLIAALLCTLATLYLLYSFKFHGVFFYEYGFIYRNKKHLYDDVEFIHIRREYFKRGHIVGRIIWDVKLKNAKKTMMWDSQNFPSLMNVMEEVCRQTAFNQEKKD